jgi:polysulfide reductase-like protein
MSPASASATSDTRSYHGQPVIKEPIWTWEIPVYFFTGGLGGASAGLAMLADLRGNEVLARRAWTIAMAGISASPLLLISDLGRPSRFLNMFRMFKITSPMSVGSWLLGASGAATAVAAANEWTGLFETPAKLARPAAALLGLPLSTYTAALVTNTAVPAWHDARRMMPFVFGSGAALSAGAAAVALTPPEYARPARRLALASAVAEMAFKETMQHRLGDLGEPYKHGASGIFGQVSRACLVTGAALLWRKGGSSRPAAALAGALLGAGALSARISTFRAGFQSASDPRYVVGPQRAAVQRGERRGASRRKPTVEVVEPGRGSPAHASPERGAVPASDPASAT